MPQADDPRTPLASGRPRRAASWAAVVLGTTLAPWLGAVPASAVPAPLPMPAATPAPPTGAPSPTSCKTIRYDAAAASDVLDVASVNPGLLGLHGGRLTDVGVGQARATLLTTPTRSTAAAGSVSSGGTETASQQAPPTAGAAAWRVAGETVLGTGAVRLGSDRLQAMAHWHDGYRCGAYLGEASDSSATLGSATMLAGNAGGQSLLEITDNTAGGTTTGLLRHSGHAAAAAGATLGVTQLRLFGGTSATATVKVLQPASLNVIATGLKSTSSVRYSAPVVEVATPSSTQRLSSPGAHVTLPVPASLGGGSGAVLRLSLGTSTSKISGTQVHASAGALRVKVTRAGATALDLTLGVLDVVADAAKAAATGGGGGYGSGSGGDSPSPSSAVSGTAASNSPSAGPPSSPPSTPPSTPPASPSAGPSAIPSGTPSSSPSGSPSIGPSPTPTPVPSNSFGSGSGGDSPTPSGGGGSASASAPTLGSGSGGGLLPTTGPDLVWFLAGGSLLAGTGYVLMLLSRRRRTG